MENSEKTPLSVEKAGQDIEIVVYTDPLCCWSWAFDAQLYQLQEALQPNVVFRICMGGMLPSWNNFRDEVNCVSRPLQMGPVWMHAGQIANRPIDHSIWMKDPPASSYPACIAVKSAQLQSNTLGFEYLQLVKTAGLQNGKNIAKQTVLEEVAEQLADRAPTFDINKFKADLTNNNGINAFKKDLEEVQRNQVNRFPTLLARANQKALLIPGYRSYAALIEAIAPLIKEVKPA